MKMRNGFVSNSSSSSFVCDVSGESYEGYDGDYGDIQECSCVNGHTFSNDYYIEVTKPAFEPDIATKRQFMIDESKDVKVVYALKSADDAQILKWWIEENWVDDYNGQFEDEQEYYECSEEHCPICTFAHPYPPEINAYLLNLSGRTMKDILQELKDKYTSYADFKKEIKV